MLSEVEVNGFKGLSGLNFTGFRRVNLIGGKNNAGKTSLLEALFLSMDLGNPRALSRHLSMRGMDMTAPTAESLWAPAFNNYSTKSRIEIKSKDFSGVRRNYSAFMFTDQSASRPKSPSKAAANVPGTVPQPKVRVSLTRNSKLTFEATASINQNNVDYNVRVATDTAPLAQFLLGRQRPNLIEAANYLGELDQQRRTGELVDVLRIFEPNLVGLSVVPIANMPFIYADVRGMERKIPINLMGDGITKFLDILLRLSQIKGGYLLCDEIENGFHYSVLPKIWEALYLACKQYHCQLFATTHSYECLSAFANSLEQVGGEDYCYYRLDRKDGRIVPTHYDAKSLKDATEGGWEVR